MSNYIRACFCINYSIQVVQFYDLLKALESLDCRYNFWIPGFISGYLSSRDQELSVRELSLDQDPNPTKLWQIADWLATPGHLNIGMACRIDDKLYEARLLQSWNFGERMSLSFDIADIVFLPGRSVEFIPNGNVSFDWFKQIIIQFINYIKPIIGVIDYEADLLCASSEKYSSLASWGNYFSQSVLEQWTQNDVKTLLQVVSESTEINNLGVLTFIHPLAANQAWTGRHQEVQTLLERNLISRSL